MIYQNILEAMGHTPHDKVESYGGSRSRRRLCEV